MSLSEAGEGSYMSHLKTRLVSREGEDEEARKRLRIERLKKRKTGAQTVKNAEEDWAHTKTLQQVSFMRETSRDLVAEKVVNEHTTQEFTLDVRPGENSFLPYMVQNPYSKGEVLRVEVHDPDVHRFQDGPELSLVHNQKKGEWRYWHENGKCAAPHNWDCVDADGNVLLES